LQNAERNERKCGWDVEMSVMDKLKNKIEIVTKNRSLRNIKNKPQISHRKRTYKTWHCIDCEHNYFYAMIKCPLCESHEIEQVLHEPNYYYNDMTYGVVE
jgi:Zn finger protein HypA/HybF involved in hydrogenase expression